MPEALTSAAGYLRQISEVEDDDPIEVKPILLEQLELAAQRAKKEMSGECETKSPFGGYLYRLTVSEC